MPTIELITTINAPIRRCFDLARSIELHSVSTPGTNEKAIAGVTKGLVNKDEQVTWRAKHLGITQNLSSKISAMEAPFFFEDIMLKGVFKKIRHGHFFEQRGEQTIMKDVFEYEAPLGFLGRLADVLFLKKYMKRFLEVRNALIKEVAEGEEWKTYLIDRR